MGLVFGKTSRLQHIYGPMMVKGPHRLASDEIYDLRLHENYGSTNMKKDTKTSRSNTYTLKKTQRHQDQIHIHSMTRQNIFSPSEKHIRSQEKTILEVKIRRNLETNNILTIS